MSNQSNWNYILLAALVAAVYGLLGWALNQWRKAHPAIWRIENQEEPGNPVIFVEAVDQWEAMRLGYEKLESSVGPELSLALFADGIQPIEIEPLADLAFRPLSYRLLREHNYVAAVCRSCGEGISRELYASEEPYIFCDAQCAANMPALDPQAEHEKVIITWFDR